MRRCSSFSNLEEDAKGVGSGIMIKRFYALDPVISYPFSFLHTVLRGIRIYRHV